MWSLPDIEKMNAKKEEAAKENANKTEKQLCKGETCEVCDKKATTATPYWDIFSDEVSGYSFACKEHEEEVAYSDEGFFTCSECGRRMITNITWENYYTTFFGNMTCLNCALDILTAPDSDAWITAKSRKVTWEQVKAAPHVIAHSSEYWKKSLMFTGNARFDSCSGNCISGGGGVEKLQALIDEAIAKHGKALLILDGAYQFSVSIGVYAPKKKKKVTKKKAA